MEALDQDGNGEIGIEEFLYLVSQGKLERVRSKFRQASYGAGIADWCE